MNKQDFYQKLEQITGRLLDDLEVSLLDNVLQPSAFDRHRTVEFIPIQHAQERAKSGNLGHWLYDRKTQTWIINMGFGSHECLMKILYAIYHNMADDWFDDEFADEYILQHYGFFLSASMNMYIPIKDDALVLLPEEQVFDLPQVKGKLDWRGI